MANELDFEGKLRRKPGAVLVGGEHDGVTIYITFKEISSALLHDCASTANVGERTSRAGGNCRRCRHKSPLPSSMNKGIDRHSGWSRACHIFPNSTRVAAIP